MLRPVRTPPDLRRRRRPPRRMLDLRTAGRRAGVDTAQRVPCAPYRGRRPPLL